jgi:hypothetical protein
MYEPDDFFYGDADIEQAQLEAAGRASARGHRRMKQLRADGKLAEAAAACTHGAGYPTDSPAARNANDPRAGEIGHRCTDCGSFFAGRLKHLWDVRERTATAPCELSARA